MEEFKWLSYYSVGNSTIDNQHKKLISLINTLFSFIGKNVEKEKIQAVIDELIKYTVYHFEDEEKYLEKFNYPKTETHKIEHEKFTQQVLDFNEDFKKGIRFLNIELYSFLRNWLHTHIAKTDKDYSRYFKKNKITDFFDK